MMVSSRQIKPTRTRNRFGYSDISRRVARAGLVLGIGVIALAGCAAFPIHQRTMQRQRPVAAAAPQPSAEDRPTDREQAMLGAVQEFLRSTDDFKSAEQPAAITDLGPAQSTVPGLQNDAPDARPHDTANKPAPAKEEKDAIANGRVALSADTTPIPGQTLPVIRSVSIAAIPTQPATVPQQHDEGTTNQSLEVQVPVKEMNEARFIQYLKSRTNSEDAFDSDSEWRLRLVEAALDHAPEATDVSPTLPSESGSLLKALVGVIDAVWRTVRDPLAIGDEALQRIDELRYALADRADPKVRAIELCRKVVTYGVYEEMGDAEFIAGQSIRTIVYTEIANLSAEETPEGRYRTSLATRAEVLTARGESVWQHEEPEIVDLCSRRRQDFFIAQRITLPPTLAAGDYVLKLMVEDKLSGKADESSRPFVIQSPLSLASSS